MANFIQSPFATLTLQKVSVGQHYVRESAILHNIANGGYIIATVRRIDYFNDFPLTLEGAESIHVYEICNNFQALGVKVRLFSPATTTPLQPKFSLLPIWTPPFLKSVFYQLFVIPKIISAWHKAKPDAIYIRVTPILLVPALFAKLYHIPVFVEINGTIHPELEKANTKLGRILLFFHISDTVERILYRQAKRVITVTESLKTYLVERFKVDPTKIIVIENGVDADILKPKIAKAKLHKPIVVGYVGGLMWWQGLNYVIDAFSQPPLKGSTIQLVIVGDGPERIALAEQVAKAGLDTRISFRGKIHHDEVAKAIHSFDICVAYYVKARAGLNSPFKIYEYLACGKPVIVSDITGTGDTFSTVTEVAAAEDPTALATAISKLANDPALRTSLGKKARQFILDGHTWKDVGSAILGVIEQAITSERA